MSKRKKYSNEFKQDAVNLAKSIGLTQAATNLGVHVTTLSSWKKQTGLNSENPEKQSYSSMQKEIKKLKKKLMYAEKINEVLKKSTAILSADLIGDIK